MSRDKKPPTGGHSSLGEEFRFVLPGPRCFCCQINRIHVTGI